MSKPDSTAQLLIALKALLYVVDRSSTMGAKDAATELARRLVDDHEGRPRAKGYTINGIPPGWYDAIDNGDAPHPLGLLAALTGVAPLSHKEGFKDSLAAYLDSLEPDEDQATPKP